MAVRGSAWNSRPPPSSSSLEVFPPGRRALEAGAASTKERTLCLSLSCGPRGWSPRRGTHVPDLGGEVGGNVGAENPLQHLALSPSV